MIYRILKVFREEMALKYIGMLISDKRLSQIDSELDNLYPQ
jgi:hypothetical protein